MKRASRAAKQQNSSKKRCKPAAAQSLSSALGSLFGGRNDKASAALCAALLSVCLQSLHDSKAPPLPPLRPHHQILHLMRHGTTEMNVHLGRAKPGYGEPGFVDPLLFDTALTAEGAAGARAAARKVARLSPKPEVRLHWVAALVVAAGRRAGVATEVSSSHLVKQSSKQTPIKPIIIDHTQLLVLSPLSRALNTALLAFGEEPPCPVVVEPLFRCALQLLMCACCSASRSKGLP